MEFGSFKQCINIYYESQHGPIRGQQCVIKITPTTNIVGKVLQFRNASKEVSYNKFLSAKQPHRTFSKNGVKIIIVFYCNEARLNFRDMIKFTRL